MANWGRHESLRARVLDQPQSAFTALGGHLAISASLPSGREPVVEARDQLQSLLAEADSLLSVDCGDHGLAPCVVHLKDERRPHHPDVIFVGSVCCAADVSPWMRPLPSLPLIVIADFIYRRADLRSFSFPLRKKILLCDCRGHEGVNDCWAEFLQNTFAEFHGERTPGSTRRAGSPIRFWEICWMMMMLMTAARLETLFSMGVLTKGLAGCRPS